MLSLFSGMWAPPWAWFSDPAWVIVLNVAFWPCYVLYLVVRDRLDRRPSRA